FYILDRNKDLALTAGETHLPADAFASIAGNDGKIDTLEFLDVVDSAFKQADTNQDGLLDRQEFVALLTRIRNQ
ncbi:EF-hand domain-containing protein, partial [Azospirillum brasilense]